MRVSTGGAGGLIQWQAATRNRARVEVFGSGNGDVTNGTMDISTFTPPTVIPIGSLEGNGLVKLGRIRLAWEVTMLAPPLME